MTQLTRRFGKSIVRIKVSTLFLFVLFACTKNYASIVQEESSMTVPVYKRTIYVDSKYGVDSHSGLSIDEAIRSLYKLNQMGIQAGDKVLFKGGETYYGMIKLVDLNEVSDGQNPIYIGTYGDSEKANIVFTDHQAGVMIQNSSNIMVENLDLTCHDKAAVKGHRYGIRIFSTSMNNESSKSSLVKDITIANVYIHDIFTMPVSACKSPRWCRQWDMADEDGWGWGIFASISKGDGIEGLLLNNVKIENVSHTGLKLIGNTKRTLIQQRRIKPFDIETNTYTLFQDVQVNHCQILNVGGPGIQFNRINEGVIKDCLVLNSGSSSDVRKWGRGSGMWMYHCDDLLIAKNQFIGAEGIADCCGAHIDIGNRNVVLEYNLSQNNAGGFVEVLGNNYNCSYRYNVSINDGWRDLKDPEQKTKWGELGTLGCLVTINGHGGDANQAEFYGPFSTYIYNNTIICQKDAQAPYTNPAIFDFATSARGILFTNNLLWVYKKMNNTWSGHSWKDGEAVDRAYDFRVTTGINEQGKPIVRSMNEQEIEDMNVVCTNNLYREANILPDGYWDLNPIIGNPEFVNQNGRDVKSFIPTNKSLIEQGVKIQKLSSDSSKNGLKYGGLNLSKDYFGHKINVPIIGAIIPQ